jgi:hypothetical protein
MDKELVEKMNAISEWEKADANSDQAEFSISFSADEAGLIKISSAKGSFTHKLKPLNELYAQKAPASQSKDDQLALLYAIEGSIKRFYERHPESTDSRVILALEKLAVKPETVSDEELVNDIIDSLRMQLSTHDYSRDEVRRGIRKILESAKRHNDLEGRRGYLDFILEYVP